MKTILFYAFFLLYLSGDLLACYSSQDVPTDSNTNWLDACKRDSDCKGADSCICGVCTTYCTDTEQCEDHSKDSVCIGLDQKRAAELCENRISDEPIAFCALGCENDQECVTLDKGLSCIAGYCIAIGENPAPSESALSDPKRLGQQGDYCSASAPCQQPLICGYSSTCERHQVVSHANSQVLALAANDQYIYWFESDPNDIPWIKGDPNIGLDNYFDVPNGIIARAPIEGGPREVIVDGIAWPPAMLMVDDTHLYYGRTDGQPLAALWRTPLSGTTSGYEASGAGISEDLSGWDGIIPYLDGIAQDSTHVFVVHGDGRLIAIDKSTGDSEQVAWMSNRIVDAPGVAVDQDCLYVCTTDVDAEYARNPGDLNVRCYDKQNWQETVIANLGGDPTATGSYCRLDITDDYLIAQSPKLPSIIRIDKESGETLPLKAHGIPSTTDQEMWSLSAIFVIDLNASFQAYGEHVYWMTEIPDDPDQYLIRRTSLEPGQTETMLKLSGSRVEDRIELSTPQGGLELSLPPIFLVTDDAIFWTDLEDDKAIMRLELP